MKVIHTIDEYKRSSRPVVLTIGNFDGVHLGHQKVINRLTACASKIGANSVVITFQSHPRELLNPDKPISLLCSPKHKAILLEELNVDVLAVLEFSREFANQNVESFLLSLLHSFPLSLLILGHDARIGKGREGDRQKVMELARTLSFEVEYMDEFTINGSSVSSSHIRQMVQSGCLRAAEKLLGRKYSIFGTIIPGLGCGKKSNYLTVNLNVLGLCLPPYGEHAVRIHVEGKIFEGVAYLGVAPSTCEAANSLLEIHLFQPSEYTLDGKDAEVIF
jgi:riboflavin kinase / FMN adenylyltransferase